MGQMMQGMPQGRMEMMQGGMRGGPGRGTMSWFSPRGHGAPRRRPDRGGPCRAEAVGRSGEAVASGRNRDPHLATLHLSHMQVGRRRPGCDGRGSVAMIRTMADRMSLGADALRKLADAAAPLYAPSMRARSGGWRPSPPWDPAASWDRADDGLRRSHDARRGRRRRG